MSDRGILFSAPMVRALLAGTKTQTRRAMKEPIGLWETGPQGGLVPIPRAWKPGDRLWVREAWRVGGEFDDSKPSVLIPHAMPVLYEADKPHTMEWIGRLRPGMFMPRWASRITLHVTDVRVQRLQEISEADAIAEGIELVRETAERGRHWRNYGAEGYDDRSALHSYRTLWNSVHGHIGASPAAVEPWGLNPWVTATSFTVERCNIALALAHPKAPSK